MDSPAIPLGVAVANTAVSAGTRVAQLAEVAARMMRGPTGADFAAAYSALAPTANLAAHDALLANRGTANTPGTLVTRGTAGGDTNLGPLTVSGVANVGWGLRAIGRANALATDRIFDVVGNGGADAVVVTGDLKTRFAAAASFAGGIEAGTSGLLVQGTVANVFTARVIGAPSQLQNQNLFDVYANGDTVAALAVGPNKKTTFGGAAVMSGGGIEGGTSGILLAATSASAPYGVRINGVTGQSGNLFEVYDGSGGANSGVLAVATNKDATFYGNLAVSGTGKKFIGPLQGNADSASAVGTITAAQVGAAVAATTNTLTGVYPAGGAGFAGRLLATDATGAFVATTAGGIVAGNTASVAGAGAANKVAVFDGTGNLTVGSVSTATQVVRTDLTQSVTQTPGTRMSRYQSNNPALGVELALGTDAAPITVAGAGIKVSTTWNQVASVYPPTSGGVTEGTASIAAYARGTATNQLQVAGIFAAAETAGTDPVSGDAVAVFGVATALAGSTRAAYGGYFHGERTATNGFSFGAEIRAQNESSTDSYYNAAGTVPGQGWVQSAGIWVSTGSRTGKKNAVAVGIGNTSTSQWLVGVSAVAGSVRDVTYDDYSSSTTSHRIAGAHSYGMDTTLGTFTGGAARFGNAQYLMARNAGNTADVSLIGLRADNRVAFYDGAVSVGSAGDMRFGGTLTSYPSGFPAVPLTDSTGRLTADAHADGSIGTAKLAPARVTAGPGAMQVTVAPFAFANAAGQPTQSAGGALTLTAPATSGYSKITTIYADATGAPQFVDGGAVASNPTPAAVPTGGRLLATLTIAQSTTAITQGMLNEYRDLLNAVPPPANSAALPNEPYVVRTNDAAVLPNSVSLDGSGPNGGVLSNIKTAPTDASLLDMYGGRRMGDRFHQFISFSGAVVTLVANTVTQRTVFYNGKQRANSANVSVSLAGQAAGAYRICADVSGPGPGFALAAIPVAQTPTADQVIVADLYFDGTACFGDASNLPNGYTSLAVTGGQIQPRIVNQTTSPSYAVTNTAMAIIPSATFPAYVFRTSGNQYYYFKGTVLLGVVTPAAATVAIVQGYLNGNATGASILKSIAGSSYDYITLPTTFALNPNAVNNISFGCYSSVATGFTVQNIYLQGEITSGVV